MSAIRMRIINPAAIPPIVLGTNPALILADQSESPNSCISFRAFCSPPLCSTRTMRIDGTNSPLPKSLFGNSSSDIPASTIRPSLIGLAELPLWARQRASFYSLRPSQFPIRGGRG